MYFEIEKSGVELDAGTRDFVVTMVGFAARYNSPPVERVEIHLERDLEVDGSDVTRCALTAQTIDGERAHVESVDVDVTLAVQEAADQLELALYRLLHEDSDPVETGLAA